MSSLANIRQLLASGKTQQAKAQLLTLTQKQPQDLAVLALLSSCYVTQGDTQQAVAVVKRAITIAPDPVHIHVELASIYKNAGDYPMAEQYCRSALALQPSHSHAWHCLGLVLMAQGHKESASQSFAQAEANDPFNHLISQAQAAGQRGEHEATVELCQQILKQHKTHPRACYMMAMMLAKRGYLEQANHYLQLGLEYSPYNQSLWSMLSQIYVQLRQYQGAIEASKRLTELQPEQLRYWMLHADNLTNGAQYEDALIALDHALKCSEEPAGVHLQQGHIYKTLGLTPQCIAAYRQCLSSPQTKGAAYWALANLSNFCFTVEEMQTLEAIGLDTEISQEQACQAAFALAKALEDKQDYKRAFIAYKSANLNRPGGQFSPDKFQKTCSSLIKTFDQRSVNITARVEKSQVTPIFVVGLPRSGSTLIEQILASHSQVEGTQELKALPAIAKQLFMASCHKNGNNQGNLDKFSPAELGKYGELYLNKTAIFRADKAFFIDKLPPNFQHVGLIHKILPGAIIIDARRQPLACGFGLYKQYFGHGHDFSYNLQHIAFYYQRYLEIMDHWHSVLPNKVLCVQYENMVRDTQGQIERLLEHCGLAFEQACLHFYQTERAIQTASSEQVRQPINDKGMLLWRHYEAQLQPLKQALGEQTLSRFSEQLG